MPCTHTHIRELYVNRLSFVTKVLHQQAGNKETVHYSCEELPEQVLQQLRTVKGIPVYLQEGTSWVRRRVLCC